MPTITFPVGSVATSTIFNWTVSRNIGVDHSGVQTFDAGDVVFRAGACQRHGQRNPQLFCFWLPRRMSINSMSNLIPETVSSSLTGCVHLVTFMISDGTESVQVTDDWTLYASDSIASWVIFLWPVSTRFGTVTVVNLGDQAALEGTTVDHARSATDSTGSTLGFMINNLKINIQQRHPGSWELGQRLVLRDGDGQRQPVLRQSEFQLDGHQAIHTGDTRRPDK